MADRKLTVNIVGDSSSLERAFSRSKTAAGSFEGAMVKASRAAAFAGVAIGAGLAVAVTKGVRAASDLNEQMNKSAVVFGSSAASVQAWSKTTATSLGISQRAALEAAGGFGQMLETAGLSEGVAADFSKNLVKLAADMASFNNIDPTEALQKLKSGLAGEAEPLRTVGVLLSEARVKTEAYRSGIAKQGAVLTEAQKVQARYNLILQDTAKQQGDFARTSTGLANSTRIIKAEFENASASLGRIFLPAVASAVSGLAGLLADVQKAKGASAKFNVAFTGLDQIGRDLLRQIGDVLSGIDWDQLGASLAGFVRSVHERLTAFIDGIDWQEVGKRLVDGIGKAFVILFNFVKTVLPTMLRLALAVLKGLAEFTLGLGKEIGRALIRGIVVGIEALGRLAEIVALKIVLKIVKALDFSLPLIGHVIPGVDRLVKAIQAKIDSLHGKTITISVVTRGIGDRRNFDPEAAAATTPAPARTPQTLVPTPNLGGTTGPTGPTAAERAAKALQRLLDTLNLAVARAGLTKTLKDDLAANQALITGLRQQIKLHKDDLSLQNDLVSAQQARLGLLQQQKDLVRELVQQQKDAELASRNARQFKTLGLGPTGQALIPLKTGLARQLKQVTDSVAGSFLDTGKTQKVLAAIRKLVLNPFTKVSADVRATIKGMLDDITKQLKDHQQGPLTKTTSLASAGNLFGGLGLDRATQKALQARLSGFNSAGTRLAGVGGGGVTVVVHHETKLDGRVVEHSTTKHQQRRVRQNPSTRRGRR